MDPETLVKLQHQMRDNQQDLEHFLKDVNNWEDDIKQKDKSLKTCTGSVEPEMNLPPIRNSLYKKKFKKRTNPGQKSEIVKSKKISGYDFKAWDKFDVEAECEAVDARCDQSSDKSGSDYETDEEWELQRAKQQANMDKDRGNMHFKERRYEEAIDCYTSGIQCDPSNAILPANRAMAALKLHKFSMAELDCTRSLSLDPSYIKAYLRRGAAKLGLGRLREAQEDFQHALTLEPDNRHAAKELEKIEAALDPAPLTDGNEVGLVTALYKPPHLRSKKHLVRVDIQEIGAEDGGTSRAEIGSLTTEETGVKRQAVSKEELLFEKFVTDKYSDKCYRNHNDERIEGGGKQRTDWGGKTASSTAPKNSFQFQAAWKGVGNDLPQAYLYLKLIEPRLYPQLFGEMLDSDVLGMMLNVFNEFYLGSGDDVVQPLRHLTKVKRFRMTVMFMSAKERQVVADLLLHIGNQQLASQDDLKNLHELYGV